MQSFGHSERIVCYFTFHNRLYRVQQKRSKLLTKVIFGIKSIGMAGQKCSGIHSKRESIGVSEFSVSQTTVL